MTSFAPAARAATPEFFPLPESRGINAGMVADSNGNIWFGANAANFFSEPPELGRVTPGSVSAGTSNGIAYFHTPKAASESCCAYSIRDLAYDAENQRIWFTRSMGVYGFGIPKNMTPGSSSGIQVAITPGAPDLGGIAIAPGGTAWFAENGSSNVTPFYGNRIASTDGSLVIHELPDLWHQTGVPEDSTRYDAKPAGVTIDEEGFPWFAEENPGNPGYRLAKAAAGLYQEYQVKPCEPTGTCSGSFTGTGVLSVATGPEGDIWFTNVLKNGFGKFDPVTRTFTQYSLTSIDPALAEGQPRVIRAAPDGTLWLAEYGFISHPNANAVVRIVPTDPPTATVYKLGAERAPISLAPDSNDNVWFGVTGGSSSSIGRLAGVLDTESGGGGEEKGSEKGGGGGGTTPSGGEVTKPPQPAPGAVVVQSSGGGVARVNDPTLRGGNAIQSNQICVGPPQDKCSLVYLLDSHEYVNGLPGTQSRPRPTRRVVVGSKSVTLNGGESATVTNQAQRQGQGDPQARRCPPPDFPRHAEARQGQTEGPQDQEADLEVLRRIGRDRVRA